MWLPSPDKEERIALNPDPEPEPGLERSWTSCEKCHRQRTGSKIGGLVLCVLGLLAATLGLLSIPAVFFRTHIHDIGYHRLYSPMWNVVSYTNLEFDTDPNSTSPFRGEIRPELDDAWRRVVHADPIVIPTNAMDKLREPTENAKRVGDGYLATVEMFRQLQCLDYVRRVVYRDQYAEDVSLHESQTRMYARVDQCIDLIRQAIQCQGDVGLVVLEDDGENQQPQPRRSSRHVCRDFEAIRDWVHGHAWDGTGAD